VHAGSALGDLAGAARSYEEARDCAATGLVIDATAGLAAIAFARGDTARSAAHVATILPALRTSVPAGMKEPARVHLTCYRVLSSSCDPQTADILVAGHKRLQDQAGVIENKFARQRFLDAFPAHRELLQAWRKRQIHAAITIERIPPPAYIPAQTAD